VLRFGVFELDLKTGELRTSGRLVNLQPQPSRVLALLASRAGELVSREELRQEIWGKETFVDFEHALNFCVRRIRASLGDDADIPRYIETLPRRGYRFIAKVEWVQPATSGQGAAKPITGGFPPDEAAPPPDGQQPPRSASGPHAAVPQGSSPVPVPLPSPAPQHPLWWSRMARLSLAVAGLVVVGAGIYGLRPAAEPRVLQTAQLTHFGRAAAGQGVATDGARIYFSELKGGRYIIDQVSASGGEPTPLPLPFSNGEVFDVSPDHTELLVASFSGLEAVMPLWVAPVTGGSPRRLGDALGDSGAWSPDGKTVAYTSGSDLNLVNNDGTAPRRIVRMPAPSTLGDVRWSPSGRVLRFDVANSPTTPPISEWEVSADGSGLHPLPLRPQADPSELNGLGTWMPDGRYFVFRSYKGQGMTGIWAVREAGGMFGNFNRNPVELYGSPQTLYAPLPSTDGKRIFFISEQEQRELVRYDAASRQFVPYFSGIFARYIDFSRNGKLAAYNFSPGFTLWLSKPDGSEKRQLSFSPMETADPHFSPDGRQIATSASIGTQSSLYLFSTEEGGKPERLGSLNSVGGVLGWSPDGASFVFWRRADSGPSSKLGLYLFDLKTREASLLPGSEDLHHGALSPDGLHAVALGDSNKSVVLYDLHTHRQSVLARGAVLYYPCWSHDGREVFYQDIFEGPNQPIYRLRLADRKVEQVTNFTQAFPADVAGYRLTGLTPDDSPLATLIRSNSDLYALDVDFP
jgi:DNA-binding winged helix-turn-helix (wHTH) protein/Tol biopolymer transport system component